jgi:hypothetical protein
MELEGVMNCPMRMRELADKEWPKKEEEQENLAELQAILAGPEEDYVS